MWRAAGLEEPNAGWKSGARGAAATWEGGQEVDNTTAGGFFQQYGRERDGPRVRVIPAHVPAAPVEQAGSSSDLVSDPEDCDDSDDSD